MTVIRRATDTTTGISVVRNGDLVESFNILGRRIHVIDPVHVADGILTHRWLSEAFDGEIMEVLGGHFVDEFAAHGCSRLLADLSTVTFSWDGVNDWLRDDLMPRLYAAGLRHLAVVIATTDDSESSRFAAERFSDNPGVNAPFVSEAAALAWLKAQP
jgi:hypothetical protein